MKELINQDTMPKKKILDREIGIISTEINQTRELLASLERQRSWMIGIQKGIYPPLNK